MSIGTVGAAAEEEPVEASLAPALAAVVVSGAPAAVGVEAPPGAAVGPAELVAVGWAALDLLCPLFETVIATRAPASSSTPSRASCTVRLSLIAVLIAYSSSPIRVGLRWRNLERRPAPEKLRPPWERG